MIASPNFPNFPVALLLFLTTCAGIGTSKSLGIFLQNIAGDLRTHSTDIRIALGLFSAFSYIPAPLVAALYRQRPLRRVLMICGSCLVSVGIMLTSLSTHEAPIGIFLPVSGLGNCLLLTTASIALNDFASPHFNLIYSLAMSGFGVGMVALPFLTEFLGHLYGWRGGLLILGALIANIIPCAVAVRFPTTSSETHTDPQSSDEGDAPERHLLDLPTGSNSSPYRGGHSIEEDESESSSEMKHNSQSETYPLVNSHSGSLHDVRKGNCELTRSFSRRVLAKFRSSDFYLDPAFNFFFVSMILVSLGYCGWHAFLIPQALQRGLSVNDILILSLSASVGSVSGRVLVGVLSDNRFSPVSIYLVCTLLNIASLLCDVFLPTLYVNIVTSYTTAGTIGGRGNLGTLAARERASAGKKDLVFALGIFCVGIGALLGSYYSGAIASISSHYDVTWWLVSGICLEIVIFLTILVPLLVKKR